SQLSLDDCALGTAVAGNDHSLLPGLVPDALYRSAAFPGFDVFDFQFLPRFAARIVPRAMVSRFTLPAFPHGPGNRAHGYQYARSHGSAGGKTDSLCAHAEISR